MNGLKQRDDSSPLPFNFALENEVHGNVSEIRMQDKIAT
jgi:hypothetical protein